MKIPNNLKRTFSPAQRFVVVILLAILMVVPGAVEPKPAEAVAVMAVIGVVTAVVSILDYGHQIYKSSQGSTFCRINQAATQKTVWADIGDIIQIPIDGYFWIVLTFLFITGRFQIFVYYMIKIYRLHLIPSPAS